VAQHGSRRDQHRVIIGACGTSAAETLPAYLTTLRLGIDGLFTVLLTSAATHFLSPDRVESLAERVAIEDSVEPVLRLDEDRLVSSHDLMLVLPATAHLMSAIACGATPDSLSAVALRADFPVVLFPAMDRTAWGKPAVQRNARRLREDGYRVVEPVQAPQTADPKSSTLVPPPPAAILAEVLSLLR